MPVCINVDERVVPDVSVQIERLRIVQLCVRYRLSFRRPVRRHEASHRTAVVARREVVVSRFYISFFAGEVVFGGGGVRAGATEAIAEGEAQALRRADQPSLFEFCQLKKNLLPRLNRTLDSLRKHRVKWQSLSSDERARQGEIGPLLRRNQDVAMKFILLDRENEQGLLRRGLVPPRQLPSVNRQRPHFVAELYRRQCAP